MKTLTSVFLCALTFIAMADIQITTHSPMGGSSTLTSNGKTARMDGGAQPGYVLLDLKSGKARIIDDRRRTVMEMGAPSGGATSVGAARPAVQLKIDDKGAGPTIAGYKTRRYNILANGRHCETIFGSRAVLKLDGVEEIFAALANMERQSQDMMGAYRGMREACEEADAQMSGQYQRTGAPMRVLDAGGQLESEVTAIAKNVSKPASFYTAPSGYQVTNMQQQMDQARQQQQQMMRQMQQSVPDMQRMMQQMQQQEGMPPEAMEQMRKMQQMFQQQMPAQ